ncbi:uncharacterized protein LOC106174608 [Lingula anatina]|uniref:Uncharacterized protein LOC106174608 n=1 Tax=Lingula anatina TaxID=7574 RepID=A0A1S3JMU3_LINAN|nr:uncharacterized protein LOC106174608 [Lingula anatina]|eukprot:XP_013411698.1 uncharacterized protein LOC106174608 [Lingula anatina]
MASLHRYYTIIPKHQAVCDTDIVNDDKERPHADWRNLYEGDIVSGDYDRLKKAPRNPDQNVYGLNEMQIEHGYELEYLEEYLEKLNSKMVGFGQEETEKFKGHIRRTIDSLKNVHFSLLRTQQENFYMVLGEEATDEGSTKRFITFLKSAVTKNPPPDGDEASSSVSPSNTHAKLAIFSSNTFQKSLQDHILSIRGHLIPCLQALVRDEISYTVNSRTVDLEKGEMKQAEKKFSHTRKFKWALDKKECKPEDNELRKVHLDGNSSDHILLFREQRYSKRVLDIPKIYVLIGVYCHSDLVNVDKHSKGSTTPVNTTGKTPKELVEEEMRAIMSTFNIDEKTGQMRN